MKNEEYGKTGLMLIFGMVVLFLAVLLILGVFGLGWDRTASPIREETRRLTYEQSQTYQHGMAVDLDDLCREYRAADGPGKAAIADAIRLRSSRFTGELPPHIQACLEEVR